MIKNFITRIRVGTEYTIDGPKTVYEFIGDGVGDFEHRESDANIPELVDYSDYLKSQLELVNKILIEKGEIELRVCSKCCWQGNDDECEEILDDYADHCPNCLAVI